jgi:sulfane dehydrogenase subunit SoxC
MPSRRRDRRKFLKNTALAAMAMSAGVVDSAHAQAGDSHAPYSKERHLYGRRSRFETATRYIREPGIPLPNYVMAGLTPIQDSIGIITPSGLHFLFTHGGHAPPDIDPRQHRLMIHGMVERPLVLSLDEIRRLPSVSRIHVLECGGNSGPLHYRQALRAKLPFTIQSVHGDVSCSEWTGVPLSLLLKEAGLKKGASWVLAEGADGNRHTMSIPIEKAMEDVLIVYGQNGEALRPEQGYPLRFLVPGWEGVINVKWLRRIKLSDQPFMTKNESTSYLNMGVDGKARWFQFEKAPKALITFPSDAHRLPGRGFYQISGLAWSGGGTVRRVEVSTDGGRTWKDAQLQDPVLRIAFTRFTLPWNWQGEEAVLQARCTDDRGIAQPSLAQLEQFWGVASNYWKTGNFSNFNAIQPWKVNRDGSIVNAMYNF